MSTAKAIRLSDICPVSQQSYREDLVCALLQGIGLFLCVGAIAVLISLAGVDGDPWRVVSFSIYGATLIIVYLTSTLYHSARHVGRKRVLKLVYRSNIHLLIAGTYTPFALVTLNGGWGWSMFGIIWGLTVIGIALHLILRERFAPLSHLLYLAMGWLGVVACVPIMENLPLGGVVGLVLGGMVYSVGVIFYLWVRLPFNHLVFQLFVLAGTACFYFTFIFYVLF